MNTPRFHPVNEALIAHSVPLIGCERNVILLLAGITLTPIAATGVFHWQIDLFSVAFFIPLWLLARALYLWDPRSASKIIEQMAWRHLRYAPHTAQLSTAKPRAAGHGFLARAVAHVRGYVRGLSRS